MPSNELGQFGNWTVKSGILNLFKFILYPIDNFLGVLFQGAERATVVARIFTAVYFAFFAFMPWYTAKDKTLPEPERVTY